MTSIQRYSLYGSLSVLLLTTGLLVAQSRAQVPTTLPELTVSPAIIVTGEPTTVTVSIAINNPAVIPQSVRLYEVDKDGKAASFVSRLYDDGTHGDAIPADRVFSTALEVGRLSPDVLYMTASVGFRWTLRRLLSPKASLSIVETVSFNNSQASIVPPPGWVVYETSDPQRILLLSRSAQAGVTSGELNTPPDFVLQFVANDLRLSLDSFVDGYQDGWFSHYDSDSLTIASGQTAIIRSDITSLVPSKPENAAFVSVGQDVLVMVGNDLSSAAFVEIVRSLVLK